MDPLGFRFDEDAVLVGEVAHTATCPLIAETAASELLPYPAGSALWAQKCPRVCGRCQPRFLTLLNYQPENAGSA